MGVETDRLTSVGDPNEAKAVVADLRRATSPSERKSPLAFGLYSIGILLLAVFPILTISGTELLICGSSVPTELGGGLVEICSDDTDADGVTEPIDQTAARAFLAKLDRIEPGNAAEAIARWTFARPLEAALDAAIATERSGADALTYGYQMYRSVVVLFSAALILVIWMICASGAQTLAINRHWRGVTDRLDSSVWWQAPSLSSAAIAVVGFLAVSLIFIPSFDLPGALDDAGFPTPFLWSGVAALTIYVTAITAWGTLAFTHNYPRSVTITPLVQRLRTLQDSTPSPTDPAKQASQLEIIEWVLRKGQGVDAWDPVPVHQSYGPKDLFSNCKQLCVVLGITMILTLVTVTLGFDVLEMRLGANPRVTQDLLAAASRAGDAWVLTLGLGMSASLFLLYMYAAARLMPYIEAGKTAPGPPAGWSLTWEQGGKAVQAEPISPPGPTPHLKGVEDKLGADDAKMALILKGGSYGGGFHAALDEAMTKRFVQVLGLLAPALAGGLLSLV